MGAVDDRSRGRRMAAAALFLLGLAGAGFACNRHGDSSAVVAARTPASGAQAPTTKPTTRPAATLTVDGRAVSFPAAKLVVTKKSDGLDVVLCSDDPPTAIQYSYLGNSFFFEMRLDVEEPGELGGAVWTSKVPDHQVQDTPNGVFLNGARQQLQPADVRVSFERRGDQLVANLSGRFLAVDARDPSAPARTMQVDGSLDTVVQEQ